MGKQTKNVNALSCKDYKRIGVMGEAGTESLCSTLVCNESMSLRSKIDKATMTKTAKAEGPETQIILTAKIS